MSGPGLAGILGLALVALGYGMVLRVLWRRSPGLRAGVRHALPHAAAQFDPRHMLGRRS